MSRAPEIDLAPGDLLARLSDRFGRRVLAVDSHTAGESTRVLVGGMPAPSGCRSVAEARAWMQREGDALRRFLTREPRGHRDLVGAWITAPFDSEADFGVVFMDAKRYPFACGTATVGAITTMLELGLAAPRGSDGEVVVETPAGLVRARAERDGDRVTAVEMEMVPSCVVVDAASLELSGGERASASVAYVGGCLALVASTELSFALEPGRAADIIAFGEDVISAANDQLEIAHPISGGAASVDGCVLYDPSGDVDGRGFGAVVYGAAHLDRSPCGTGTAAKMTRLHARGELRQGQRYENRGILGTAFQGWIAEEAPVGRRPGVRAHVRASAQLVGASSLFADPDDPFPDGFLLPG